MTRLFLSKESKNDERVARIDATRAHLRMSLSLRGSILLVGCVLGTGCAADVDSFDADTELDGIVEGSSPLEKMRFPGDNNGTEKLCFTQASTQRADFTATARKAAITLAESWVAAAKINLNFEGKNAFPTCPSDTTGWVVTTIMDGGGLSGPGYFGFAAGDATGTHHVPHEMGHVLGFTHEYNRSDFGTVAPSGFSCTVGSDSPNMDTPPDPASVLIPTGCGVTTHPMSFWDGAGAWVRFGYRTPMLAPLVTWKDGTKYATASVSTASTGLKPAGYEPAYPEGWTWVLTPPGHSGYLTTGEIWKRASTGDLVYVANSSSKADVQAAGYVKDSTLSTNGGQLYTSSQPGTTALKLYQKTTSGTTRYATTANSTLASALTSGGWTLVRTEGYIFTEARPYQVLYDFLKSDSQSGTDYALSATLHSTMDDIRADSTYSFSKPERSLIMTYQVPGTVPLKVYYNSTTKDYYTTIKSLPSGYTNKGTLGYVFTSSNNYTILKASSYKTYTAAQRTDYRTHSGTSVAGWNAVSSSTFYALPSALSLF